MTKQILNRAPNRPHAPKVPLKLTAEIIKNAEQRNSAHCMLAEAVKAAVPNAKFVSVDLQTIRFTDPVKRLRYTYLTPRTAQIALLKFDLGEHTEPGLSVELRGGQVTKARGDDTPQKARMPKGKKVEFRSSGNGPNSVPEKIGGSPPPIGPLANVSYRGQRRVFGLRGLAV